MSALDRRVRFYAVRVDDDLHVMWWRDEWDPYDGTLWETLCGKLITRNPPVPYDGTKLCRRCKRVIGAAALHDPPEYPNRFEQTTLMPEGG